MQDTPAAQNGTGHDAGDLVAAAEAFVDVATAAARLGISEDGVRRRIQRGRLPAIKGTDGQWSIPAAALAEPHATARQDRTERPAEQDTTHDTTVPDTGSPPAGAAPAPDQAATQLLITALQDEVGYLRRQVEARDAELARERAAREEERRRLDEALAEERRLLAGLIQRVPQLLAPDSATDTTELSPEQDTTVAPTTVESPAPAPPRRWWQVWRWGEAGAG